LIRFKKKYKDKPSGPHPNHLGRRRIMEREDGEEEGGGVRLRLSMTDKRHRRSDQTKGEGAVTDIFGGENGLGI
jgi:hypothetical protein